MSTYFRDGERYESTFPTIRGRTGLLEPTQRTTITTLDDDFVDGRGSHATYTTTVHRSREEGRNSPVFYPRPPSPGRKLVAEVCCPEIIHVHEVCCVWSVCCCVCVRVANIFAKENTVHLEVLCTTSAGRVT